jgi:hypothetical protein
MKMNLFLVLAVLGIGTLALAATDVSALPDDNGNSNSSVSAKAHIKAQAESSFVSRVIPQASLLVTSLSISDSQANSFWQNKVGYSLGATVDLGPSQLVLETGLLYRAMGSKGSEGGFTETVNDNYLAVPVIGKFYFAEPKGNAVYLKGGFIPQYLVSKSVSIDPSLPISGEPEINTFDLEWTVGGGYKLALNESNSLFFDLSYSKGMTTIDGSSNPGTVYNTALMFTTGFGFDL